MNSRIPPIASLAMGALLALAGSPALAGGASEPDTHSQGLQLHLDPETGERTYSAGTETRPAERPGLQQALNRSDAGLDVQVLEDGTRLVDLQGRFRNVSSARIDSDGELEFGCFSRQRRLQSFVSGNRLVPGPADSGEGGHE